MTTKQFLTKQLGRPQSTPKYCSSVMVDYDGVAYSYGFHYPLAVRHGGYVFVNNHGYSNTTAKHINWAFQAGAALVGAESTFLFDFAAGTTYGTSTDSLYDAVNMQITKLADLVASKRRKDTQVYSALTYQLRELLAASVALSKLTGIA
jgi:hypothetical protein